MKFTTAQNQRSLLIAISWLMARLWIGAEISRLAIFRMRPKSIVYQWRRNRLLTSTGHWIFDRNKLFYLAVNDTANHLIISETESFDNQQN